MTEPYQVANPDNQVYQPQPVYQQAAAPVVDNGGFGWGFLGFLIPLVGLILFLVWKDTKAAGIGALVSVIAGIVLSIAAFVLSMVAVASLSMYY